MRMRIAQIIALVGTVISAGCAVAGFKGYEYGAEVFGVGVLLAGVSYLICGLFEAIKMAWNIAISGLFMAPLPSSFVTLAVTACLGLLAFVMLPIIPVRRTYLKKLESGAY